MPRRTHCVQGMTQGRRPGRVQCVKRLPRPLALPLSGLHCDASTPYNWAAPGEARRDWMGLSWTGWRGRDVHADIWSPGNQLRVISHHRSWLRLSDAVFLKIESDVKYLMVKKHSWPSGRFGYLKLAWASKWGEKVGLHQKTLLSLCHPTHWSPNYMSNSTLLSVGDVFA